MSLKTLSFSKVEYHTRVKRLQDRMTENRLDVILCHSMSNICYLTGYESLYMPKYYMALVPGQGEPILFCQDFEMHNAQITAWPETRVTFAIGEDPVEGTVELLKTLGYAQTRVGVEMKSHFFPAAVYCQLKDALPEVKWVDTDSLLQEIKLIKSPAEINYIRRASRISSTAMASALAAAREGITDNDIAASACKTCMEGGSEYMCIDPIITVGKRSGIPHTTHRRVKLEQGDCVFMEIGACVHRYTGAIMRTACIGSPSPTVRRLAEGCIRSVEAMIDNIRPGRPASEVAHRAKAALGSVGDEFLWHGYYGYSLGLGFPPDWADAVDFSICLENPQPLRPGMVFHCNTSLRKIGYIGVALSETILVTENGCEVLTNLPRELMIKKVKRRKEQ